MTVLAPDTLADLRVFLRTQPDMQTACAGRVFFRLPDFLFTSSDSAYQTNGTPAARLYRAGGGLRPTSEALIDDANIAVECWGAKGADYPAVRLLYLTIASVLHTTPSGTLLNPAGSSLLLNADVSGAIDAPDPETGWPRLVVHAKCTTTFAGVQI